MKRNLLTRLLIGLALLVVPFALPTPVSACSCMLPGSPAEAFRDFEAVFSGEVTSVVARHSPVIALLDRILLRLNLRPSSYFSNPYWGNEVTFTVHQAWKGVSATEVTIYTGSGGGDCGYLFIPGKEYLVYAYEWRDQTTIGLGASICSRTAEVVHATEDLTYLNTHPTLALTPVSKNTWLYVAGCSITLFISLGVGTTLWVRHKKRQTAA